MKYSREQIFAALFTRLQSANYSFAYTSRRWKHWSDERNWPSMYLNEGPMGNQTATQVSAYGLTRWQLKASVWVYFKGDPSNSTIPATTVNEILDAIEAALQGSPQGEKQTLGGLVENAFIDGTILIDEGVADEARVGVIVIPISLIAA